MEFTVEQLAARLGGQVFGDPQRRLSGAQAIHRASPQDLTFVANEENLRKLASSRAGCVLLSRPSAASLAPAAHDRSLIGVDDPQGAFLEVMAWLHPADPRPQLGISPHAFVSPAAQVGAGTNISAGAFIAHDVQIGRDCDIYPGVYIGPGCRVGDQVTLHPHVVLYAGVQVGHRVIVHAHAVLGADGFGYRLEQGRQRKLPHYGGVRIEDDVEIGACATVDAGMIGPTIIGAGSKLDNLVMIAHNCELGKHNILVSQVGFAGSVTTGDYVVCAGHVGVADHVHLGDRCVIGSKAGVHKDVPPGETYIGIPAEPAREAMKAVMSQKKIPEMRQQLKRLEQDVARLSSQLQALQDRSSAASLPAGSPGRSAA